MFNLLLDIIHIFLPRLYFLHDHSNDRTCVYNSLRSHYEVRVLLSRKHCKAHYNGETSFLQRVESITNPI